MRRCALLALLLAWLLGGCLWAAAEAEVKSAVPPEPAPAEAPLVESPLVESPLAEPVSTDAPLTGVPSAEALSTEAPSTEASSTIAPSPEAAEVPSRDETTQESAWEQPEGVEVADVPSVVMTLEQPSLPLTGIKIGIDPGHQARGNNEKETVAPGSGKTKPKVSSGTSGVATHIAEYVTVLDISLKLRDALELQGAQVYMTRETHDVNISNQQRAKLMNDAGVDLVLRIHCDGAGNRSKHGVALYCSRSNAIAAESHRAAEAILPAVCAATGAKNNGIVSNDDYTGQNWSTVPCIMVECGFMSNPDEDRLLNDEDYQWKLAAGLTQGIVDYIEARDGN